MEVSVSEQLYVFLVMTLCGVVAGAVFDIFRIIRKTLGANILTTSLGDILFWLIISAGTFFTVFFVNSGEIRWFEVIGMLLGGIIYFLALSSLFLTVIGAIFRFFVKIFAIIFKIILTPLVFLYKMIKRSLYWILKKIVHTFRRRGKKTVGLFGCVGRGIKKFRLVMKKS